MKVYVILCILLIEAFAQQELSLLVEPETQRKLSLSIKNLVGELQTFRTPKQSPILLYSKVADVSKVIQEVRNQLGHFQNVVLGERNLVKGSKNILVGKYDSIIGSNNFILVDGYDGSVNGALLVEKWKIILDKKEWIKTNPNYAIFFINQEENRKYQRYLNRNRGFSLGSNLNRNSVLLIEEASDQIKNQIAAGLAVFEKPDLISLFGSNTLENQPQKDSQTLQLVNQNREQTQLSQPLQIKLKFPSSNEKPFWQTPVSSTSVSVNDNNPITSYPAIILLNSFGQNTNNQVESNLVPQIKNKQVYLNPEFDLKVPFKDQNVVSLHEKQQNEEQKLELFMTSNLKIDETPIKLPVNQQFNSLNAKMRSGLSNRYVRSSQNIPKSNLVIIQSRNSQALPSLGNSVLTNLGSVETHYKKFN